MEGRACRYDWREAVPPLLNDPALRPALAYALTWLRVAGGNSVLSPWVRHRLPWINTLLDALREDNCRQSDCPWCREVHDPLVQLRRYFGFEAFRPTPAAADGGSLQQAIVEHLNNPVQQAVVAAPVEDNLLILAGPGSGKTRVVVHRVAWLLRVGRSRPWGCARNWPTGCRSIAGAVWPATGCGWAPPTGPRGWSSIRCSCWEAGSSRGRKTRRPNGGCSTWP
ncbi:MAG: AAA family ATPase [Candidatus Competibacteraceae bacterium]|nr:AAA family ATPase [Candidatus Competibacteraceae bacterium]